MELKKQILANRQLDAQFKSSDTARKQALQELRKLQDELKNKGGGQPTNDIIKELSDAKVCWMDLCQFVVPLSHGDGSGRQSGAGKETFSEWHCVCGIGT